MREAPSKDGRAELSRSGASWPEQASGQRLGAGHGLGKALEDGVSRFPLEEKKLVWI